MTLVNAIEDFDRSRANSIELVQKIRWISELDSKINEEYLLNRGGEELAPYTLETSGEVELKAPDSFTEIYALYLNMKLDYFNGEITRFNNSASLFNRLYKEMGDAINRRTPVSVKTKIKAGELYV